MTPGAKAKIEALTESAPLHAASKRRCSISGLADSLTTQDTPTTKKVRAGEHKYSGTCFDFSCQAPMLTSIMSPSDYTGVYSRSTAIPRVSSPLSWDGLALSPVKELVQSNLIPTPTGINPPVPEDNTMLLWQSMCANQQMPQDPLLNTFTVGMGTKNDITHDQSANHPTWYMSTHSITPAGPATTSLLQPSDVSFPPSLSGGIWPNKLQEDVFLDKRPAFVWPSVPAVFDYLPNPRLMEPRISELLASIPIDERLAYYFEVATEETARNNMGNYQDPCEPLSSGITSTARHTEESSQYHAPFAQWPVCHHHPAPQKPSNIDVRADAPLPRDKQMLEWDPLCDTHPTPHDNLNQCLPDQNWPETFLVGMGSQKAEAVSNPTHDDKTRRFSDYSQPLAVSAGRQTLAQCNPCKEFDARAQPRVMVLYDADKSTGKMEKPPRKPRRRPTKVDLVQMSQTRQAGACIRCKIQRIRCIPNVGDPAAPCQPCSQVVNNLSRNVIHHIACHRYKLGEMVLFRTSASIVTNRWHGDQVRNVSTSDLLIRVHMMQEYVGFPFAFEVGVVASKDGYYDDTTCDWYDGVAVVSETLPVYALVDVQQTTKRYKEYIRDNVLGLNCGPSVKNMAAGFWDAAHDAGVVGDVYARAWEYFCSLPRADDAWELFYQRRTGVGGIENSRSVPETAFLLGLFELQFALRHATGWSWLHNDDIPDAPRIRRFPPLRGRIGTPRLVVGQIDAIRISSVLKPLTKSILRILTAWTSDRKYDCWLSIFFAVIILLAEIANATEDAYHQGWYDKDVRGNGPKNAHDIKDLHETSNIILAHWHYYNCGINVSLLAKDSEEGRKNTPLRSLSPGQLRTAKQVWDALYGWRENQHNKKQQGKTQKGKWWVDWCHPMYFVDQMIDVEWTARPVFS